MVGFLFVVVPKGSPTTRNGFLAAFLPPVEVFVVAFLPLVAFFLLPDAFFSEGCCCSVEEVEGGTVFDFCCC